MYSSAEQQAFLLSSHLSDCPVFGLCENVPVSHVLLLTKFFYVCNPTLLYDQETTTAKLQIYPCFPDRLVILDENGILSFQTIRKRDFD